MGRATACGKSEKPVLFLIGGEQQKRTVYMKKAADSLGIKLSVITWKQLREGFDICSLQGAAVKIDPPAFETVCLEQMQGQLAEYVQLLRHLEQAPCTFLNPPQAIIRLLDKKQCKEQLQDHGVSTTRMLAAEVHHTMELLELMESSRCHSVFVKPRYFSGAAGVAAFRIHPRRGEMILYTSCRMEGQRLVNTKKLHCMRDGKAVCLLLDRLLSMECVVERWHPKAETGNRSYDLRIVYQFGHIAHIVVRCSRGPVTNLHLNNQALEFQALGFTEQAAGALEDLCAQGVSLFPGLAMAGIDVLVEKDSLRPRIIEMNGQGDLIYQDIYGKNRIYCEQAAALCGRVPAYGERFDEKDTDC